MADIFGSDFVTNNSFVPAQPNPLLSAAAGQPPRITPLPPEESDSLLSKLGNKALGGLAYAGSSLGKAFGGRAIRGILGGNAREALSIIPFLDALGTTDPDQEVRGEDLLQKWGALDRKDPNAGLELRDLAGLALEMAHAFQGKQPSRYTILLLTDAGRFRRKDSPCCWTKFLSRLSKPPPSLLWREPSSNTS